MIYLLDMACRRLPRVSPLFLEGQIFVFSSYTLRIIKHSKLLLFFEKGNHYLLGPYFVNCYIVCRYDQSSN